MRCINFQSVFSHPSITYILKEKIDNFNPFHARKITSSELYSQRLFTFISVCYSIHINKPNMIVNHISCFRVYNNGEKLRHTALHKKFRVARVRLIQAGQMHNIQQNSISLLNSFLPYLHKIWA